MALWNSITAAGLALFFVPLLVTVLRNPSLFTKRYGRHHRVLGGVLLLWLVLGFCWILFDLLCAPSDVTHRWCCVTYDIILGILGTAATLSAAKDFKRVHEKVQNVASGTLEPEATVTYSEMIEHSFYQILNLLQVVYLHSVGENLLLRFVLLLLVTSPWLVRHWFPVHSFSDNYKKNDPWTLISILYRVKKYQYVFYKHALLHGLNIAVALSGEEIATTLNFRLYWLALNASYVMEFFLQSMVKKKVISQHFLLILQKILMFFSSMAALPILSLIPFLVPITSCTLNFMYRGHDLRNTMMVFALLLVVK